MLKELEARLPGERLLEIVRGFLEENHCEADGERLEIAREVELFVEQRALVARSDWRNGGYLSARVVIGPIRENGTNTGTSRGGTVKLEFSLDGAQLTDLSHDATMAFPD